MKHEGALAFIYGLDGGAVRAYAIYLAGGVLAAGDPSTATLAGVFATAGSVPLDISAAMGALARRR